MPMPQTGTFETPNASKYLQQLCKHFAHKVPASFDTTRGAIEFPFGEVRLSADDAELRIEIPGSDEDTRERGRNVIDRHLERFAFRESFTHMNWQPV
nr:DUF2218 domain-containing protein [Marinovum algicola]